MQLILLKYGITLLSIILLPLSKGTQQLSNNNNNNNKTVYIPYNFKTSNTPNYFYYCEDSAKYIQEESVEFRICGELFHKSNYSSKILSSANIDSLNIRSLKWIREYKKSSAKNKFNHNVFEQVYIIEYLGNDNYITYDVTWNDPSLGIVH
ncbi:MAG: hypothetical protein ACQETE_04260 [Bacteroidota bacterium]